MAIDQKLISNEWLQHLRNETNKPNLIPHTYEVSIQIAEKNPNFSFMDTDRPIFYGKGKTDKEKVEKARDAWMANIFSKKNPKASFAELDVNTGALLVKREKAKPREWYRKRAYVRVVIDGEEKLYFITSMRFIDDETIHYSLILDVITTYLHKITFKQNTKTKIKRRHFDRWLIDTNQKTISANLTQETGMFKDEKEINLNNFITSKAEPVEVDVSDLNEYVKTLQWEDEGNKFYMVATIAQRSGESSFNSNRKDGEWISNTPWITIPMWPSRTKKEEFDKKNVFYDNGKLKPVPANSANGNLSSEINAYGSSVLHGVMPIRLPLFKKAYLSSKSGSNDRPQKVFSMMQISKEYAKTSSKDLYYYGYILGDKKLYEKLIWGTKDDSKKQSVKVVGKDTKVKLSDKPLLTLNNEYTFDLWTQQDFLDYTKSGKCTRKTIDGKNVLAVNINSYYGNYMNMQIVQEDDGKVYVYFGSDRPNHLGPRYALGIYNITTQAESTKDVKSVVDYTKGDEYKGEIDLTKLGYKDILEVADIKLDQKTSLELEPKLNIEQFKKLELRNTTGNTFRVIKELLYNNTKIDFKFEQYVSPLQYKKVIKLQTGVYSQKLADNSGTFIINEALVMPSKADAYNDFLQTSQSAYNTSKASIDINERQRTIMGGVGIAGSVAGLAGSGMGLAKANQEGQGIGMAGLGVGGSIIGLGSSIASLVFARQNANLARRRIQSSMEDLERTPATINNNNLDSILNVGNQAETKIGNTGIVAITRELPEIEKEEVFWYLTKNGYTNGKSENIKNYTSLIKRSRYSYWEIENIGETIEKDTLPPEVLDHLNGIFASGIRLWNVNEKGEVDFCNYEKENWELTIAQLL